MDFDIDKDFGIFDDLLKKRPEITSKNLKHDLKNYYLPYVKKLTDLKTQKNTKNGIIVGVSAIQGAGKTTQGEILEVLLNYLGFHSESRSIDDHYITHKELCILRNKDPRFIRRGVTHDIKLAIEDLKNLQKMEGGSPVLVSGYDKGVQDGDGDRLRWINPQLNTLIKARIIKDKIMVNKKLKTVKVLQIIKANNQGTPIELHENMGSDIPLLEHFLPQKLLDFLKIQDDREINIAMRDEETIQFATNQVITIPVKDLPNGCKLVTKKPDFIFYDGWMLGVRSIEDDSVFNSKLPALETEKDIKFAKDVNKKLKDYEPLWEMFEFLNVLYVPNYQDSLKWRDQAEEVLRKRGEGMSRDEIKEFVYYFWRSVHPAIHIKNLAQDEEHTDQVVIIKDNHTVGEILTPNEVKVKYP